MYLRNHCWLVVCGVMLLSAAATAELQNVEIGGKIETFSGWYTGFFEPDGTAVRIPAQDLRLRPIGPFGTESVYRLGDGGHSMAWTEQRTRLHLKADFTDNVAGFIEFDEIHSWGEGFRSNYLTGVDARGNADVSLFQAYIDVDQLFSQPLRLRIGRQEMEFGSGWLVGADPGYNPFVGLSFDAARLTYNQNNITVDAWWSKVADLSPVEEDGDIDFYGIYATWAKSGGKTDAEAPPLVFDVYWMYLRDAQGVHDAVTDPGILSTAHRLGLDDYDVTNLYTAGARTAGTWSAFDWELEVAYQWGNADALGALFVPNGGVFGDDRASWDHWGGHASVGYGLDVSYKPHFTLGGIFYEGEDNRDFSPRYAGSLFARPNASVSFNRLFSSSREDEFMDTSAMSNLWKAYVEATVAPTEKVELRFNVAYLQAFDGFDYPPYVSTGSVDPGRITIAPDKPWLTKEGAKDIGWQATIGGAYQYSDALSFELVYSHFFVGDGLRDGVFVDDTGLLLMGGRGNDDINLVYFLTTLEF